MKLERQARGAAAGRGVRRAEAPTTPDGEPLPARADTPAELGDGRSDDLPTASLAPGDGPMTAATSAGAASRGGADEPEALPPGTHVGRYVIVDVLGAGGMGVIYRAHDPYLARDVALKLLHAFHQHAPGARDYHERLMREAQALAKLSHPNVVAAHDVGTHEGAVFIAMELVAGVSLRSWLGERHSRREVMRALIAAGRGLAAAHASGVMHRDFKPANVMVSPDGRVRVVDFGLARATGEAETETETTAGDAAPAPDTANAEEPSSAASPSPFVRPTGRRSSSLSDSLLDKGLTRVGTIMGTPGYMALEQLEGGVVDTRADQFSFAATVFMALCGRAPFHSDSTEGYREAIVAGARAPWPTHVPRRLRRIVERGLAVRGRDRYPSVAAMVDALERASGPRRGIGLALGALAVVTAGAAVAIAMPRAPSAGASCSADPAAFAGRWDAARRGAVERAFVASGSPHGAETFRRVAALLDGYADRWLAMREEVCTATHIERAQSERVLDLRTTCLDRQRVQVGNLVVILAEADAALVDRAVTAATGIGDLASCADVTALMGESDRLPDDPGQRATIDEISRGLDDVDTLRLAARYPDSLARSVELVERAREVDHKPTLASATFAMAVAQISLGRRDEGNANLESALDLAAQVNAAGLMATITTSMLHGAVSAERWTYAQAVLPMVTATVRAAGDPAAARVQLLIDSGAVLANGGDQKRALAQLEEASSECAKLGPDAARRRISVAQEVAFTYLEQGDLTAAVAKLREVIAAIKEVYGPTHPTIIKDYNNLAVILGEAKDLDGALAALAESRKVAATMPPSSPTLAFIPSQEGWAWHQAGNCDRALPLYQEAIDRFVALYGEDANEVITTRSRVGECLLALDRPAEALPILEATSAARVRTAATVGSQANARFLLARARWSIRAQRRDAVRLARSALEMYEQTPDDEAAEIAEIEQWLATHADR